MQVVIEIGPANWLEFAAPQVNAPAWTAVIPAAGRGSRLGFDKPKILYPVAGRPLLEWMLDYLTPNCARFVFVLSPAGEGEVRPELERLIPGRYEIAIQEIPNGMGDAVAQALPAVATPHAAIVWGDQVALRPWSVAACLRLHEGSLQPDLTCPTVMRHSPYIHFERDESGRISGLRQAREGDTMPEAGESDTGFFCFRVAALRDLFTRMNQDPAQRGRATGEVNFLPLIPLASLDGFTVITPRLMTPEETVGINSVRDIGTIEQFLRNSHASTDHYDR